MNTEDSVDYFALQDRVKELEEELKQVKANYITNKQNEGIEEQNDEIEVYFLTCGICRYFDYPNNWCRHLECGVTDEHFFCKEGDFCKDGDTE